MTKIKKIYKNSILFKKIDGIENKHFQKNLTNHEFTILCPNCIGGLIYHRLGERFDSPTIDLSINTDEYCSLISNLDFYLSKEVIDSGFNTDGIPTGVIEGDGYNRDIHIVFTHYKTFEEAKEKWNRRKKRIHKDNLYVIAYDIGDMFEEDHTKCGYISDESLKQFESIQCNNKVLLTRNPYCKSKYAYYIEPNYNGPFPLVYLNRTITGLMEYENKFDFVSFINTK